MQIGLPDGSAQGAGGPFRLRAVARQPQPGGVTTRQVGGDCTVRRSGAWR